MKRILNRYREPVLYLFFGGCTTLINYVSYWILRSFFRAELVAADVIAWVLAVSFAFVTNRIWVFKSDAKGTRAIIKEAGEFFLARIFSLVVEVVLLLITVQKMGLSEMWMKLLVNVIVIVMNYVLSKLWIFRIKDRDESEMASQKTEEKK